MVSPESRPTTRHAAEEDAGDAAEADGLREQVAEVGAAQEEAGLTLQRGWVSGVTVVTQW